MKYVMSGGRLYQLTNLEYNQALLAIASGRPAYLPDDRVSCAPLDLTCMQPDDAKRALNQFLTETA